MATHKKTFAGHPSRHEIRSHAFGANYTVKYDTIIDHDIYDKLRISLEVPRETPDVAVLVLNGKAIGEIIPVRGDRHKETNVIIGYRAFRYRGIDGRTTPPTDKYELPRDTPFEELGHAGAAIISNYIM